MLQPHAEASAQPTEEHASTTDDIQAAEENASSRVDDSIPAAEEIARDPLVVRLKKLKKSGQLHQLRLRKFNQIPQFHLRLPQLQFFHVHSM